MKKKIIIILLSIILLFFIIFENNSSKIFYSKESGFYESPFHLKITTSPIYTIRYTLDGSVPTTESTKYLGKILINDNSNVNNQYLDFLNKDKLYKKEIINKVVEAVNNEPMKSFLPTTKKIPKCTILNVALFDKNDNIIKKEKNMYCIGYEQKKEFKNIPFIFINVDYDDLYSVDNGLFTNYVLSPIEETNNFYIYEKNKKLKKKAEVIIFDSQKKHKLKTNAQIELSGGISIFHPHKSFKIKTKHNDFILDSSSTDFLRIKDFIVNKIQFKRLYMPCAVFLNGEFLGLYYLKEPINEEYIIKKFDIKKNNLYFMKDNNSNKISAEFDLNELKYKIENLSFEEINEKIDVESFANFYATNIYLDNADSFDFRNTIFFKARSVDKRSYYKDTKWRALNKDFNLFCVMETNNHCTVCNFIKNDVFFKNLFKHKEFYYLVKEKINRLEKEIYTEKNVNEIIDYHKKNLYPLVKVSNEIYYSKDDDFLEEKYTNIYNFIKNRKLIIYESIDNLYEEIAQSKQ